MAYAALQDAKDRYGEDFILTAVTRADTPDLDSFDKALDSASSEIDSYLASQYTVPVDPVPALIVRYCVDIAIYTASGDAGTGTDEKRLRYEDALKWLSKVAKGEVVLDIDGDGEADNAGEGGVPAYSTSARIFTRTTMGDL